MKHIFLLFATLTLFVQAQESIFNRIGEQDGYALYEQSRVSQKEDTLNFSKPGYSRTEVRNITELVTEDTIYLSLEAEKAMRFVNYWHLKDVLETGQDEIEVKNGVKTERPWQKLGFKKILIEKHREIYLSPIGRVELREYFLSREENAETVIGYVVFFSLVWCGSFFAGKVSRIGKIGYALIFIGSLVFVFLDISSLTFLLLVAYFVVFAMGKVDQGLSLMQINLIFLIVQILAAACLFAIENSPIALLLSCVSYGYSILAGFLLSRVFIGVFPKEEKSRVHKIVSVPK